MIRTVQNGVANPFFNRKPTVRSRAGRWGTAAVVMVGLVILVVRFWPVGPQPQQKAEREEAAGAVALVAKEVEAKALPLRVQAAMAQTAAAVTPPPRAAEPAPAMAAKPQPSAASDARPAAPALAERRPPQRPPTAKPAAAATQPQAAERTEAIAPPHTGAARDGMSMAAITLIGADIPEVVEGWLSSGFADLRVSSATGRFVVRFGPQGYGGPALVERQSVRGAAVPAAVVQFEAGLPPGLSVNTVKLRLAQAGFLVEVQEVKVVLTGMATNQIVAAQGRILAELGKRGQSPAGGAEDLALSVCLRDGAQVGVAQVRLRATDAVVAVASTCPG